MADINKIFYYLENPTAHSKSLQECKALLVSPVGMRKQLEELINREIRYAKKGLPAGIILKLNSLSDGSLVEKLDEAAAKGVEVKLIIRGIYTAKKNTRKRIGCHTQ